MTRFAEHQVYERTFREMMKTELVKNSLVTKAKKQQLILKQHVSPLMRIWNLLHHIYYGSR